MRIFKAVLLSVGFVLVTCASTAQGREPIKPVAHVDLPRFMGKWYVIAAAPTHYERDAYNAIESYKLEPDDHIHTAFRARHGSFNAPVKRIHAPAYVHEGTGNAVWGVHVVLWIKAQYIVAYLAPDYSATIVARDKRDYAWIMARTPTIPKAEYDDLLSRLKHMGYDMNDVRKVPQQWPETAP